MSLDKLNENVTAAIWMAEHELPGTREAHIAYAAVADLEEKIGALTDPSTVPGQASRVGAVRAVLMSGDPHRAIELIAKYRAENLGDVLRVQLDEFWEEANKVLESEPRL
jgi:hypothetical protein